MVRASFSNDFSGRFAAVADGLTSTDLAVVSYMAEHLVELPFESADTLADRIGVSRAAIGRAAAKLGYRGFSHLRHEARSSYLVSMPSPLSRFAKEIDAASPVDRLRATLELDVVNLNRTLELVSHNFAPACKAIGAAKSVHVTGNQNSAGLALYLARLLGAVRPNVHLIAPGYLEDVVSLGEDDALVAFAFQRYSRSTVVALQQAARAGATTVAITDGAAYPFFATVAHVLAVHTETRAAYTSMVASVALLQCIVDEVAIADPNLTTSILAAREQVAAHASLFYQDVKPPRRRARNQ